MMWNLQPIRLDHKLNSKACLDLALKANRLMCVKYMFVAWSHFVLLLLKHIFNVFSESLYTTVPVWPVNSHIFLPLQWWRRSDPHFLCDRKLFRVTRKWFVCFRGVKKASPVSLWFDTWSLIWQQIYWSRCFSHSLMMSQFSWPLTCTGGSSLWPFSSLHGHMLPPFN